jgi:putative colanic acid biosynthesis UDP-glucose lipid carrier transferase
MQLFEKIFQRNDKFFLLVYYLTLALSLNICTFGAYYFRNKNWNLSENYIEGSILITLIFLALSIFKTGKNNEDRFLQGTTQWFKVEFVFLIQTFLIAILISVIFKITDNYSRIWFFTSFIFSIVIFLIIKVIFDFIYISLIKTNTIQRNILLIGDTENCQNIIKKMPKTTSNSIIKCLMVVNSSNEDVKDFYGVPTFNLEDDFNYILNHHSIGQVWIISSIKTQMYVEQLIDKFLNFSIDCRLVLPESKFKFTEGMDTEAGFDFYNISFSPFYGTSFLIKNIIDKLLSVIFLIFTLPIVLIFSIFILIEDGFPIFFKQKRTGWDGRSFNIYKLRSLNKENENLEDQQVKAGDNRLLVIGKLIRRLSIDELPQFYNVLKGEMSIVGPRPHMTEHTKYYSTEVKNFMQRHKCLPGITGWAQVNGLRGPTEIKGTMDKRFQHDLYYIKNWNLMLDLYILIRTVFVVLFQKVD